MTDYSRRLLDFNLKKAHPKVLRSGWKYFYKGRVKRCDSVESEVSGTVQGERNNYLYNTNLVFTEDSINCECDCPSIVSPCKHCVAMAFAFIEREQYPGIRTLLRPFSRLRLRWQLRKYMKA